MEEAQLLPYCTRKKKSQGIYVRSYGMYESTVKIVIVEGHVVVVHIWDTLHDLSNIFRTIEA